MADVAVLLAKRTRRKNLGTEIRFNELDTPNNILGLVSKDEASDRC